jgi:lipopolysaccharide export system protein LptA
MKWLACLLPALLMAADPIAITSDRLSYHGGHILLDGHVDIVHPLAHITAEKARMHQEEGHAFELHDQVTLHFSDGGTLTCGHAFVDPDTLQGRFSGDRVTYHESEASMLKSPISLECDRMDVQTAEGTIETLLARGAVHIVHGRTLTGTADETLYDRRGQLPSPLITRYMLSRAVTDDPGRHPDQPTVADILRLRGNVALNAHTLGTLQNDDQVWLVRIFSDGEPQIDCISASGKTVVTSADGDRRRLTCSGHLFIDQACKRAHLVGNPVTYSDPLGGFLADQMTIDYTDAGQFEPTKITLTGNVRIRNHTLGDQLHLQYALADLVEYTPQSETMTLTALDTGRVLFLDAGQDTRVSAHQVVINRQEKSVEGVGQVRFSLSEGEVSALKEVFGLDQ